MLRKTTKILTFAAVTLALVTNFAQAASSTMNASIAFAAPLSITKNNDISLGAVSANTAGSVAINTAGQVTSADIQLLGGTPQAGDLTISGSTTQAITIAVSHYTSSNGVAARDALCQYDSGVESPCAGLSVAAAGAGKNLKVGVSLDVDGTQTAGAAASPSFDLVLQYQ